MKNVALLLGIFGGFRIFLLALHLLLESAVDSQGEEKTFAESLESEYNVVVYSKLPNGFYINTPKGKYNPDWAIAFREGSVKHVYFVAETKGNDIESSQLRKSEEAKIECARRHFAAISSGDVIYSVVKTYKNLYDVVTK